MQRTMDSLDVQTMVEVFDVMHTDPDTGRALWAGLTGIRAALERDGFSVDQGAMILCPKDWVNDDGYLDPDLAREHPRPFGI